jgi:hypothetical protein
MSENIKVSPQLDLPPQKNRTKKVNHRLGNLIRVTHYVHGMKIESEHRHKPQVRLSVRN